MTRRFLTVLFVLFSFLIMTSWKAQAREREDNEPVRVRLNADQIDNLTTGYSWVIVNDRNNAISHTYFREDGVRFTRRNGQVDQMNWSIREEGLRCVHIQGTTRCGLVANIDGQLTICMQVQPMGDCAYSITERRRGDAFGLEQQYRDQNPALDA